MSDHVAFELDGKMVTAEAGQSIWDIAKREGTLIPHLCHADRIGFAADGNCRACMGEIEGERVLAASCIRKPTEGMKVHTATKRAEKSRKMVMELLIADQPDRETSYDSESHFWKMADQQDISDSRFIPREMPTNDLSHPAMAVNLDACINCNLCVRACRDVQVNDVIGMAGRGVHSKIVFDFDDPMGDSTCVGCGECVQACPTGALLEKSVVGDHRIDREVDSICPFCGVGCQLTFKVRDNKILFADGRDGPANEERLYPQGGYRQGGCRRS